ncbi:MAG: lipoyl(octanoyl) transferase LipB [Polyangiaceae bacterium]|nr:lipoyl(octanoyl) transferase LipB [Polyangiaceae bacterium]
MRRPLHGRWLGRRRYEEVHELQKRLHAARQADQIPDTVLLLEHEPVITLGRGAKSENVLAPRELLAAAGVDLVETGRGGDVTLHAPGQLVCYPIVSLAPDRQDVRRYVADLAETMRRLAARHGIAAGPVEGLIGVWVDKKSPHEFHGPTHALHLAKLGAIGVRISRWVTMHGFAFNCTTDLELFGMIVPCGITQHGVTSVYDLTGEAPQVEAEAKHAIELLAEVLGGDVASYEDRSSAPLG